MIPAKSNPCHVSLDASPLMENALRRAIIRGLRSAPGLTVGDMANALAVDYKTVQHHVRVLQKAGHVVVDADGRRRPIYLAGTPRSARNPLRALVALQAVQAGANTPSDLARRLGVPRGTAGSMLDTLARRGLVERDGRRWRLGPVASDLIDEATHRWT